jgi:hypothetical protein
MPLVLSNKANLYAPYQAAEKPWYNRFKKNNKTRISINIFINNQMLIDICKISNQNKSLPFLQMSNFFQNTQ